MVAGAAVKKRDDYRSITGPEKAAMLMLSISDEHAAKLFNLLEDEEIKEVSQTMATLGNISADVVERLFVEFAEQFSSTGSLMGTYESTERLLAKILDNDRVNNIMEEIRGPAGRTMWDKLGNVSENVLANYLKNEYPQTVSVILSKVRPEHAARVLSILPEAFALEVMQRMLKMEAVQKEVLSDIEKTLRTEFMSNLARTSRRDTHEVLADIFNGFDRNAESRFMAALEEQDKEAAEKIKSLMFTFEDIDRVDGAGIQMVLRNAEKDKLALALKGASEPIRELFFSNMSERAAKILREDMEAMGPVKIKDVDEAQAYIIKVTKELAAKGQIDISDSKGGEELVY